MSHLVPCPQCSRHVRVAESSCPFCGSALELSAVAAPQLPRTRLGRAATFAFGASIVGATALVSCGGDDTSTGGDAAAGATGSGGAGVTGGAGGDSTDAAAGSGGGEATGGAGGDSTGGAGGDNAAGSGGVGVLYGAVPADSGSKGDGGGPVPVYGAPPPN